MNWTPRDRQRLVCLLREGWDIARAARTLNTSSSAARAYLIREGLSVDHICHGYVWSKREVSALFQVGRGTITTWIQQGYLTDIVGTSIHPRQKSRFTRRQLELFVTIRQAWMLYHPERIRDPELRERAHNARRTAGGHWVTLGDWARTHYRHIDTALAQAKRNAIPAPVICQARRWYVWEELHG